MLSAYPAISSVEFDKAGKALLRAYAVSHKVAEWTDLKQTKQGIFIQQKRTAPQIVQSAETITYADEGCEAVEMVEQEDKVKFSFLQTVHISQKRLLGIALS